MSQAFIIESSLVSQLQLDAQQATVGNAAVLATLAPSLIPRAEKQCQPLEKVDHYMLFESDELAQRLHA